MNNLCAPSHILFPYPKQAHNAKKQPPGHGILIVSPAISAAPMPPSSPPNFDQHLCSTKHATLSEFGQAVLQSVAELPLPLPVELPLKPPDGTLS